MSHNLAASAPISRQPSTSCHPSLADALVPPSHLPPASLTTAPPARAPSTPTTRPASSLLSYHDSATRTLGCAHYSRNCQVRAPCCPPDTFHLCRFCHDESCDHKIDRHAISDMACMLCCQRAIAKDKSSTARSQPVAETCVDCSQRMARYWCAVCKFFDDAVGRDIFHCTACGICRRGKREEFFHCQRCNCCYSSSLRDGHKCIENVLSSVCPICLEDLFSSTLPVNFLRCGHAIHVSCLDAMLYAYDQSTPWRCPTCKRSISSDPNADQNIEAYLRECPMPDEYSLWRAVILCNDCLAHSELPYHFAYHRCPDAQCRSFNTDVVTVKRVDRGSGRLPSAYEVARAAGLDANSALQAGWRQIRDDDEEEEEEESEVKQRDESDEEEEAAGAEEQKAETDAAAVTHSAGDVTQRPSHTADASGTDVLAIARDGRSESTSGPSLRHRHSRAR